MLYVMSVVATVRSWFRRTGVEIAGWTLVAIGIPLMPLPGPGTIVVVSGVALLARRYVWAQKLLAPLERRAVDAAKFGVATIPRITMSALGGVWLFALGIVWWKGPNIPEFTFLNIGFGPELPGAGLAAALGLWASAIATWVLLAYSVRRWRPREDASESAIS